MNPIRVENIRIIESLEKYMERYTDSLSEVLKEWKLASEKYNVAHTKYMTDFVTYTEEGKDTRELEQPRQPSAPVNRTKDYVFYIKYVKADLNEYTELDMENYSMIFDDKWTWMHSHVANIRSYAGTNARLAAFATSYDE